MVHWLNLQYLYNRIYELLTGLWVGSLPWWLPVLWLIIFIALWLAILILTWKIIKHRQAESADLRVMLESKAASVPEQNEDWLRVLKHLESENPAEWKLAILEADKMLDELVKTLQPHGENLGERLKSIEPSDFDTLQDAWEAHKVRNQIAHEANFTLTKHQTLQTIGRFRRVFEEFEFI